MEIQNLKTSAAHSLDRAGYDPKKLALIHTGVSLTLALITTLLQFLLDRGIDTTGGLSGIGTRTILSTLQMTLSTASIILLPFWDAGFQKVSLYIAGGKDAAPQTLLEGFRRFMPVMRLFLLQLVLYFGLMLLCANAASMLYMLTPFSDGLMGVMESLMSDPALAEQAVLSGDFMDQLMPHMIGMYVILGALLLIVAVPMFYRFRLALFVIMDDPGMGALRAMGTSAQMMRGNRMNLFRLDLSFWWFYAAGLLLSAIGWLDVLLPMIGIQLPVNADVGFFLFYILYAVLRLLLFWQCNARVQTTYAHFYLSKKPE